MGDFGTASAAIGSLFFIWGALSQFVKHDGLWAQETLPHVEIRWIRVRYGFGICFIAVGAILLILNSSVNEKMSEATQVTPWWSSSQTLANWATIIMAIAALGMLHFSARQLRFAREEKMRADEALASANEALDRAEQLEEDLKIQTNSNIIYTVTLLKIQIAHGRDSGWLKQEAIKMFDDMTESLLDGLEVGSMVSDTCTDFVRSLFPDDDDFYKIFPKQNDL